MGRFMIPSCCVCGASPMRHHDKTWESKGGLQDFCPDHASKDLREFLAPYLMRMDELEANMQATVYLHSDRDDMRLIGQELGLSPSAEDKFSRACYEVELTLAVSREGDAIITHVDNWVVLREDNPSIDLSREAFDALSDFPDMDDEDLDFNEVVLWLEGYKRAIRSGLKLLKNTKGAV